MSPVQVFSLLRADFCSFLYLFVLFVIWVIPSVFPEFAWLSKNNVNLKLDNRETEDFKPHQWITCASGLGDLYIGEWSDGLRSGQGTLTKAIQNFTSPQYAKYAPKGRSRVIEDQRSLCYSTVLWPLKGQWSDVRISLVDLSAGNLQLLPGQWWLLWRLLAECLSGGLTKVSAVEGLVV